MSDQAKAKVSELSHRPPKPSQTGLCRPGGSPEKEALCGQVRLGWQLGQGLCPGVIWGEDRLELDASCVVRGCRQWALG